MVTANITAMGEVGEVGDSQLINLAWGGEVSDYQIFESVRKATGVDVSPRYAPKRPGEADAVSLDISKAREVLGWSPAVSLEDGTRRSVAYYTERYRSSADQ